MVKVVDCGIEEKTSDIGLFKQVPGHCHALGGRVHGQGG